MPRRHRATKTRPVQLSPHRLVFYRAEQREHAKAIAEKLAPVATVHVTQAEYAR